MVADDDGTQVGLVTEINETNNTSLNSIDLFPLPPINSLPFLLQCNEGFDSAVFNLIDALPASIDPSTIIAFYETLSDLETNENALFSPEAYSSLSNPQTLYLKIEAAPCFDIYQFDIKVENCPPWVPQGFSPSNDGINDWFNIQGLYNIFLNHELIIYNRYGTLVFEGNNSIPWDGKANRGLNNIGKFLPAGTYYYILILNDPNFKTIQGWVFMNY
jgi:gliding motility-associated-like protein